MEKSTQPGEGGGLAPTPSHYIYHHVQSCSVGSSWEDRNTPHISTLSLYVLCGLAYQIDNPVKGIGCKCVGRVYTVQNTDTEYDLYCTRLGEQTSSRKKVGME